MSNSVRAANDAEAYRQREQERNRIEADRQRQRLQEQSSAPSRATRTRNNMTAGVGSGATLSVRQREAWMAAQRELAAIEKTSQSTQPPQADRPELTQTSVRSRAERARALDALQQSDPNDPFSAREARDQQVRDQQVRNAEIQQGVQVVLDRKVKESEAELLRLKAIDEEKQNEKRIQDERRRQFNLSLAYDNFGATPAERHRVNSLMQANDPERYGDPDAHVALLVKLRDAIGKR